MPTPVTPQNMTSKQDTPQPDNADSRQRFALPRKSTTFQQYLKTPLVLHYLLPSHLIPHPVPFLRGWMSFSVKILGSHLLPEQLHSTLYLKKSSVVGAPQGHPSTSNGKALSAKDEYLHGL